MSAATATGVPAHLQERARRLRTQAAALHPLLAGSYRRRAAELDVQALLEAVWNPPIDRGDTPPADARDGTGPAKRHLAVA